MFKSKLKPISVASRMAGKLVLLSGFTLSLVHLLGVIPDPNRAELQRKAVLTESLAITSSLLALNHEDEIIKKNLSSILDRHPDVLSACIRRKNGTILHQIGDHERHWQLEPGANSNPNNICVPIAAGKREWGTVELSFNTDQGLFARLMQYPLVVVGLFTLVVNGVVFRLYLARAFRYLDPSKSVPMHVRATLDTFSEGVVVLDNEQRIVLANDKFKKHIGKSEEELLGKNIDQLPWESDDDDEVTLRWHSDDDSAKTVRLGLSFEHEHRTYLVNASPILGNDGQRRGTIASFDDITPMEEKRKELSKMLSELQLSRDELKLRNEELNHLATRDPLTGCLNRRTFFEIFDKEFKASQRHQQPLSCFMVDVDHFKMVNDNHGHSVGDVVLRCIATAIEENGRDSDVVCRYGGEEFCVILPHTDANQASVVAQRIRSTIEQLEFEKFITTVSIGMSSATFGASDPQELLEQADKALYAAKRGGRNKVVRWEEIANSNDAESPNEREMDNSGLCLSNSPSIPYPAVASLMSALAYRDASTATHCTRVAELCVATASGLLSVKETYVLEVAALLHDIGKIGVPDAILLKPGPLTPEEWEMMELHDRIGVEIVEASFSHPELVDIVKYHHATFESDGNSKLPSKHDIPIGARIVTIADAYDAMVSDRVYRKGRPIEDAFKELRRCAGTQFDPELVERFIASVRTHKSVDLPVQSRQVALQLGLQIERLADAVDEQDCISIKAIASRLEATAAAGGIPEIEDLASGIRHAATEDKDLFSLFTMVGQLISLCRSAQKIHARTSFKGDENCIADSDDAQSRHQLAK
ncbi:diguanylate cyclase [Novipirellula herctigrandis]